MAHSAPLVLLTMFYGVGFVWRAWLQQRRFGSSGIMLFRSGQWSQDAREAGLLVLAIVSEVQAAGALWAPATIDWLHLSATGASATWFGSAAMVAGTVLMVVAQLDMGASWRVGLDQTSRPGLVVVGLYRFSRNPIYVALLVVLLGYTILLPTWLSLAMLVGTAVTVRNQAHEEEAFLLNTYGNAYVDYARRVGRFLPGIGRLAATL